MLKKNLKKIYRMENFGLVVVVLVEFILISLFSDNFLTINNLVSVAKSISINGLIAIGMTILVICGELDLSVGSTLGFGGAITAFAITYLNLNSSIAFIIALGSGALIGYIISLFVNKLKINSIIVTLGFLYLIRGAVYAVKYNRIATGYSMTQIEDEFILWMGQKNIGVVPFVVIIFIVFIALGIFFLNYTTTGKFIFATGGNNRAAKLSGINTEKIKTLAFIITGTLAAFAGVLTIGKTGASELVAGTGAELEIIAAVIIGGNLLAGGKGSIVGTLIGAIIIGLIKNAFVLLMFPIAAQIMGIGIIIIIAVVIDSIRSKQIV